MNRLRDGLMFPCDKETSKTFNYIRQVLKIIEKRIRNSGNLKIFAEINNEF